MRWSRSVPQNAAAVVQAIDDAQHELRALFAFSRGVKPMVNGNFVPKFCVAAPGDVVQWAAGWELRLAVSNESYVGRPPEALVGQVCAVCRVPFVPETRVVVCPCGTALHCEADPERGLQCAQLRGDCPRCGRPLRLQPGSIEEEEMV